VIRTRSARVAVVGSARRPPAQPSPSQSNPVLRRRIVASCLVIASLLLLSVYFRESSNGSLHGLQSAGAAVLRPFEVTAERIARPFRDAVGWFGDVLDAKSENERLRETVDALRQKEIQTSVLLRENQQLRVMLRYVDSPRFPADFRAITTRIISRAPTQFEQQVGIAAGSSSGIRVHDPVVTPDGLVGEVTKVATSVAEVTLLTDQESAVSALDYQTRADGIVEHGSGTSATLTMDRVGKDQIVNKGDVLVTAGWRSKRFSSIYPRGIPIGSVTYVNQTDTELFKSILVEPFVDFSSLEVVGVLVPKQRR
jgi:rod shape-determining protein MreC